MLYGIACAGVVLCFVATILTRDYRLRIVGGAITYVDLTTVLLAPSMRSGEYVALEGLTVAALAYALLGERTAGRWALAFCTAGMAVVYYDAYAALGTIGRGAFAQSINLLDTIRASIFVAIATPWVRLIGLIGGLPPLFGQEPRGIYARASTQRSLHRVPNPGPYAGGD